MKYENAHNDSLCDEITFLQLYSLLSNNVRLIIPFAQQAFCDKDQRKDRFIDLYYAI